MNKNEINFIDFYFLIYSKRYYFLLSIIVALIIAFGYYFLYNQKLYTTKIFVYHHTETDFKKWAMNNSDFFDEYFYFKKDQIQGTLNDFEKSNVFYEITRLLDTNSLLKKYLKKYEYNLSNYFILTDNKDINNKYLKKILNNIKIKKIIEDEEMLLEIKSKMRTDVLNIFKILELVQNILYFEYQNLALKEYDHNYSLFEFGAMEKYFEEPDYTSDKTKEYVEWTKQFVSKNWSELQRGEFELIYFDLNENDIEYVDSINLLIVCVITTSTLILLSLFYFLLVAAFKQENNKN